MLTIKYQDLLSPKHNKRARSYGKIQYIVVHYTAIPGISSYKMAKRFSTTKRQVSTHFVVDEHEIWRCVPIEYAAWHCGSTKYKHPKARNDNSIGVDLCEDKICCDTQKVIDLDWYFTEETLHLGAKLVAAMCLANNVPEENIIRHYDVTGKDCPVPFVGNIISSVTGNRRDEDWKKFLKLVHEYMNQGVLIEK